MPRQGARTRAVGHHGAGPARTPFPGPGPIPDNAASPGPTGRHWASPQDTEFTPPMKIDRIDLNLVRLPLVRTFRTSSSTKDHLDHILVRVQADGLSGWGECASPSDPYYCPETVETCWHLLEDFL